MRLNQSSIKNDSIIRDNFSPFIKRNMLRFSSECHKIFSSIIISNSIDMMTMFFWFKKSPNFFLNNNSMFSDMSPMVTGGMTRSINQNIAMLFVAPSFPTNACLSFFASHSNFVFNYYFRRTWMTLLSYLCFSHFSFSFNGMLETFGSTHKEIIQF